MIHILPLGDIKEHQEHTQCECEPTVEWYDPESGEAHIEALVIHNAFDRRASMGDCEKMLIKTPTREIK